MEVVKKAKEFTIFKKKSGRFAVKNSKSKWVNGEEKVKILSAEKLIKLTPPKKKEEAPAPETAAEQTEAAQS